MNELRNFFILCSGSNLSILKRTPTEINKHVGIGATIFFTGVFAAFAGGYAMYTVFHSYIAATLIGLVWGAMIFNLDRYIVSSLKMKKSWIRNFMNASPRIVLALIIAVVIAKPLELRMFDSEIKSEIALMQQENMIEQETLLRSRFEKDITETNGKIEVLKSELKLQEETRDALDAIAIKEADGTGGSLKRNMGPIYRAKKEDALKAQIELEALQASIFHQIEIQEDKLLALDAKMTEALDQLNNPELAGLASRIDALDRLTQKSNAIWIAGLFIMLLFIAIETAPIFVKLISSRSPYDYVLDKHEHVFVMNHNLHNTLLTNEVENKIEFDNQVGVYKTNLAINTEKKIIKESLDESYEELKNGAKSWRNIFGKSSVFDF